MRSDEPQEGITPFLRERFHAVPYKPGLSDNETALRLLHSNVRNTGATVEVLKQVCDMGEQTTLTALRLNADVISDAMVAAFADQTRGLFGARATEEMRGLVGGVIATLSKGFSGVRDGLGRVATEVTGIRDEVVTTREVLAEILNETQYEIEAMRQDALDTREELVGRLETIAGTLSDVRNELNDNLKRIYAVLEEPELTRSKNLVRSAIGFMLQDSPDYGRAIQSLKMAKKVYDHHPAAWYLLGHCEIELGHTQRAKEALRVAIDTQTYYDRATAGSYCRTLARLHTALGEHQTAADVLHEGSKYNPDDCETRFQYAVALATLGDFEGAAREVQGTMRIDSNFEVRTGLVPELAVVYRERTDKLHRPIATGDHPLAYDAALKYAEDALARGEESLAWPYLVRHVGAYSASYHADHFDRLLKLPQSSATTALFDAFLQSAEVPGVLALTKLLRSARFLLVNHKVNVSSAVCQYPLERLLLAWSDLLSLPDAVKVPILAALPDRAEFADVPLARVLKYVGDVRRCGEPCRGVAANLLAPHVRHLSSSMTWVLLDLLVRTGQDECTKNAIQGMLATDSWLEQEQSSVNRRVAKIAVRSGLSQEEVRSILKLDPGRISERIAALVTMDPELAANLATQICRAFRIGKLLSGLSPSHACWRNRTFRMAFFNAANVGEVFAELVQLLLSLSPDDFPSAVDDLVQCAHPLPSDALVRAAQKMTLISTLFTKIDESSARDSLFVWLQPALLRHLTDAVYRREFDDCAVRPSKLVLGWRISRAAVESFVKAVGYERAAMRGVLGSLELDLDVANTLGGKESRTQLGRTVGALVFGEGDWGFAARAAKLLLADRHHELAEQVVLSVTQQLLRHDPPSAYQLAELPRTEATVRLCIEAIRRKGVKSIDLWRLTERLLFAGTIHSSDAPVVRRAVRWRRTKDFVWGLFD